MPVFLFACAGRFGAKIRPLQLQRLAASVPDGTTKIEQLAFYGRNHHITVEIPDSVTKIAKTELEFLPEFEFPITIKAKKVHTRSNSQRKMK